MSKDVDDGFTGKQICLVVFISAVFALLQIYSPLSAPDFFRGSYQVRQKVENFLGVWSLIFAVVSVVMLRVCWKDNFSRRDKD